MNNLETNECSIWDPKTSQPTSSSRSLPLLSRMIGENITYKLLTMTHSAAPTAPQEMEAPLVVKQADKPQPKFEKAPE